MNVIHILTELRTEKQRLDEAITIMERLAAGSGVKRRGRPPLWLAASRGETPRKRVFSVETRKKMAKSQKRRGAATA